MGFTRLLPAARVKAGTFKVSTARPRSGAGPWSLVVTVPSAEYTRRFGSASRFDVLLGDGPNEGELMIRPAEGGAFKPAGLKNCFVFRLPASGVWPADAFSDEEPDRAMRDGGLVVSLPEWAWNRERQKAIRLARSQVAREHKAKG